MGPLDAMKLVKQVLGELHRINKSLEKIVKELEIINEPKKIDHEIKCEMLEWLRDKNCKWSKEN